MDRLDRKSQLDLVMYAVLGGFAIYVTTVERKDVKCPNYQASDEECRRRGGMAFSDTGPEPGDSPQQLKAKVRKVLELEDRTIKWRRSLGLAVMIVGSLLVFVVRKIIDWRLFYLGVLLTFAILYGHFNYYAFHVAGEAAQKGKASLDRLVPE